MKCACGKREIDPSDKSGGCGCGGKGRGGHGHGHGHGHGGGCGCGTKQPVQDLAEGRPELGLRAAE